MNKIMLESLEVAMKREVDGTKSRSLNCLKGSIETAVKALLLGKPSDEERMLVIHMISWLSEVEDYEDSLSK